jgi:hypothetical protein
VESKKAVLSEVQNSPVVIRDWEGSGQRGRSKYSMDTQLQLEQRNRFYVLLHGGVTIVNNYVMNISE